MATDRDRPGTYDAYYVMDFCNLADQQRDELETWCLNCLICVAALGFGDIPPSAFITAFNLIGENGWIAFNIKESFLDRRDESGFSRLIRELIFSDYLNLYMVQRYQHRLSIEGKPLFYFALGGKKTAHVPRDFPESLGLQA